MNYVFLSIFMKVETTYNENLDTCICEKLNKTYEL